MTEIKVVRNLEITYTNLLGACASFQPPCQGLVQRLLAYLPGWGTHYFLRPPSSLWAALTIQILPKVKVRCDDCLLLLSLA